MEKPGQQRFVFSLRLPKSLSELARSMARAEGISLNHFISLATAEKITRLEKTPQPETGKRRIS